MDTNYLHHVNYFMEMNQSKNIQAEILKNCSFAFRCGLNARWSMRVTGVPSGKGEGKVEMKNFLKIINLFTLCNIPT